MTSVSDYSGNRRALGEITAASISPRLDILLLVSALFAQRFSLQIGDKFQGLSFVLISLILLYQFLSGKVLVQYDRLLWFLPFALVITCSLLFNFESKMLTAYFQFMVFFSLFTLCRSSTSDQYTTTLQAFQFIVMLLSCLGVAQFVAQFVVDGKELIRFYGMVPDFLLDSTRDQGMTGGRVFGTTLKSNGLFLAEPSIFSQITALGILVEVLRFGRPRYLLVMAAGFLVAYSGTGLILLLLFLPLAGLRHGRAGLSVLFVVLFMLGLFATGIIDLSAFTSRVDEFQDPRATSGFARFVAPFWLTAKQFDTASLGTLLVGSGPGAVKTAGDLSYATVEVNWFKVFYEYGIIGLLIFFCFLASCFRRSRCPGVVIAAIIFSYLFEQGTIEVAIVLCTLSGPEPRRGIDEASRCGPSDRGADHGSPFGLTDKEERYGPLYR
jgi:hypothetical protein